MKRAGLKFWLLGAVLAASAVAPVATHERALALAAEGADSSRRLDARIASVSAENQRLSHLVAPAKPPLSSEQFHELMKLRGEIGYLRARTREGCRLKAALRKGERLPPNEGEVLARWTTTQLTPAGHGDALSGLQTVLWAIHQNDPVAVCQSMDLDYNGFARFEGDTRDEKIAAATKWAADSLAPATGFCVLGERLLSEGHELFNVYFEGEGGIRQFLMFQDGADWKLRGIFSSEAFDLRAMGYTGVSGDGRSLGTLLWP